MAGMSRDGTKQHPASLGGAGGQRGPEPRLLAPHSVLGGPPYREGPETGILPGRRVPGGSIRRPRMEL